MVHRQRPADDRCLANDPDARRALRVTQDFGVPYPNVLDASGRVVRIDGNGLPQTLFSDARGKIRWTGPARSGPGRWLDQPVAKHLGIEL